MKLLWAAADTANAQPASATSALPASGGSASTPQLPLGAGALGLPAGGAQSGPPHEIEELMPYRPGLSDYAPHLAAATAIVLLAAALFILWWKRWRKVKPVAPADPWDLLEGNLAAIAIEPPFARAAQEDVFYRMSLLLREAVELKIGLRATDLTLSELKAPLRRDLPLPQETTGELLAFLERADLVKFAEAVATRSEAEAAKQSVAGWVGDLRRKVLPAPAANLAPAGEEALDLSSSSALFPAAGEAPSSKPAPPLMPSEQLAERERHASR